MGVSFHHSLDDIGCLRASCATISVDGGRVGEYSLDRAREVLELVTPAKHQAKQDGRDRWCEGRKVTTQIRVDVNLEPGNNAVTGATNLGIGDVVATVSGGDVVLGPTLDPFDRSFELLRNDAADDFFSV